jgi:hypothetical protein
MSDEIKCHGVEPQFATLPIQWREPQLQREPYGEPFRSCSYCGSIHPEDLIKLIEAGATMHGADWKYGWPHKFYVEKIPNPHAGKVVEMGSSSGPSITKDTAGAVFAPTCHHADCKEHGYWKLPRMEPAPATTTAKFYNAHLEDCDDELLARLAPLLKRHTGIEWGRDPEKGIFYHAPSPGYQR